MTDHADLFDRARSQAEKDDGMALAAMNRRSLLAHARGVAASRTMRGTSKCGG
jgi:hypothetical protein